MTDYTIGQLAKLTNTTIVALRYYEKQGLFPAIKRGRNRYRMYPKQIVARIHFIQNAKSVGFSLEEIQTLLSLQERKASSEQVKQQTQEKIQAIGHKIQTLTQMQSALEQWEQACDGKVPIEECPILEQLYQNPKNLKEILPSDSVNLNDLNEK